MGKGYLIAIGLFYNLRPFSVRHGCKTANDNGSSLWCFGYEAALLWHLKFSITWVQSLQGTWDLPRSIPFNMCVTWPRFCDQGVM